MVTSVAVAFVYDCLKVMTGASSGSCLKRADKIFFSTIDNFAAAGQPELKYTPPDFCVDCMQHQLLLLLVYGQGCPLLFLQLLILSAARKQLANPSAPLLEAARSLAPFK